jgi:hypothetical protein
VIHPRGWLKSAIRGYLIALVAVAVLSALLLAPPKRASPIESRLGERQRLVDEATLLLEHPTVTGQGHAPTDEIAFDVPSTHHDAADPPLSTPTSLLLPLKTFAVHNAHPDLDGLVRLSPREQAALAPPRKEPRSEVGTISDRPQADDKPPIPDAIEGVSVPSQRGDALEAFTISSALHTIDGDHGLFALTSIQGNLGVRRIHLSARGADGAMRELPGWLEPGDVPAPGWRVMAVGDSDAILLTSIGNFLRLRLASDGALTALGAFKDRRSDLVAR